jgi:hypothetical protein
MSIDQTMHSLFGASKVAADVLVQEYGRYFGMKTVCFRVSRNGNTAIASEDTRLVMGHNESLPRTRPTSRVTPGEGVQSKTIARRPR